MSDLLQGVSKDVIEKKRFIPNFPLWQKLICEESNKYQKLFHIEAGSEEEKNCSCKVAIAPIFNTGGDLCLSGI